MQSIDAELRAPKIAKSVYELLSHDGKAFITCLYLTFLARMPDSEGLSYYSELLERTNDKLLIVYKIYCSQEAKKWPKKNIPGLKSAMMRQRLKKIPIFGALIESFSNTSSIDKINIRFRKIECRLLDIEANLMATKNEILNQSDTNSIMYLDDHENIANKPVVDLDSQINDLFVSFDANVYLNANSDVSNYGMNPYEHWIRAGFREGRVYKKPPAVVSDSSLSKIVSFDKPTRADGTVEWADYSSVKLRISELKLARRSEFTPVAQQLIQVNDKDKTLVAKGLMFSANIDDPDVSIIIPVFNNLSLTLECLLSIVRHSGSNTSYEVIIADDASSDETRQTISSIPNIKYIRNDTNLGFLRNCNNALVEAKGKYVVFLNNDTQVTDAWLDILKQTFDNQKNVGAVGPRFLYPNGHLQEVGAAFRFDGTAQMIGLNEDPDQEKYSYTRRVDYVSGACLMMTRELANQLNGFSENYLPCYCEDSDLCLRIIEAGYYVYVNPAATVIHHLSKTTDAIDSTFKHLSATKNVAVLKKRWLSHFESVRPKIIAFYLPQFHPFPENNKWWGEGFTEWSNVSKAQPNFVGHYQPRMPADLGFYDLRLKEVMQKQVELAMRYGIGGFCFYYYWFGGKRLLETPIEQMLENDNQDFPFCLCWANENWTRRWDGQENEVLIAQSHSKLDDVNVINDLIRYFKDKRYIRIDGRPFLLVYRVTLFPDFLETTRIWRKICRDQGIGEIYIGMVESFELVHKGIHPSEYGCDAAVEFPPQGLAEPTTPSGEILNPDFMGHVADYRDLAVRYATREKPAYTRFSGVMPGWDNTARRQNNSFCFENATPGAFQAWIEEALEQSRLQNYGDERLVFINAWNEWAEGAYLEPDRIYGHSFLEAVKNALDASDLL